MAANFSSWAELQQLLGGQPQQDPNMMFTPPQAPGAASGIPYPSMTTPMPPPASMRAGPSASHGGLNFGTLNQLMKQYDEASMNGMNEQKDVIDQLKQYRDKLPQGSGGPDLTGLMALADAWGDGSAKVFTGSYKAPETAAQREAKRMGVTQVIGKEAGQLSDDELKLLKTKMDAAMERQKLSALTGVSMQNKLDDQEEKDANNLIKFYDTERTSGRSAPISKAQGNVFQAQRIKGLLDQYKKDPNSMPLTGPSSLSEIAIGLNTLLSASGGSEESRKSLIPSSARGSFSTIDQYLSNRPVGAEMEEFVKNAADTLDRERNINQKQVDRYKQRINEATGGGRLQRRNPKRYDSITNAMLSPAEMSGDSSPPPIDRSAIEQELQRRNLLP